ncbi:MAG: LysM peptidoglycan-binding domain-containing protein [Patescibacteria group bacterium]|nr:LysM peptidoglycan-binding domain-containing protein [Patescibacteria group bacterium]
MPEKFSFFESKFPRKKKNRPNKRIRDHSNMNDKEKISRRTFLKGAGAAGLITATGTGGRIALDILEDVLERKNRDGTDVDQFFPTEQQLEIDKKDQEVVGDTIEEQLRTQNKVTLDRSTKKAIYDKWRESYSPKGENYHGLEQAMERMSPWIDEMRAVFRLQGIPEAYVYLAIPESHFDLAARSRKRAMGPFQFTKDTAKRFDLQIDKTIDERYDPVKSAEACAKHLKYSYERFNNDWDLALADYNGGYTNRYAEFRTDKNERNYDDYLAWRENRINGFISKPYFEHKIRKSDKNLTKISKMYGLSIEEIKEVNGITDDRIIIGETLKIPSSVSVKMKKLRDSLENLNYPEKFYAVLDVIKENGLTEKFTAQMLSFDQIEVPKLKTSFFTHTIGKGEGLLAIARKVRSQAKKVNPGLNLSVFSVQGIIQKQNKIEDPRKIFPGQKLKIELPIERGMSLVQIADRYNILVKELKRLNPAVTSLKIVLPEGIEVRIPKKREST